MSVLEKAKELGIELSNSKELHSLREAEEMMLKNQESQKAISEFNEKQEAFQVIQSQGLQLTEGQKKELEDLEMNMLNNPYVYNFFKAQQEFENVLQSINNIIAESIGMKPGDGCDCGCGQTNDSCDSGCCS